MGRVCQIIEQTTVPSPYDARTASQCSNFALPAVYVYIKSDFARNGHVSGVLECERLCSQLGGASIPWDFAVRTGP